MLNMLEVENTINELEKDATTLENCRKLAILYTVRANFPKEEETNKVVEEYREILPSYESYCRAKREFQTGSAREDAVLNKMQLLCTEIEEFIRTLYYNTDMPVERDKIHVMLKSVSTLPESAF